VLLSKDKRKMKDIDAYISKNVDRFVGELCDYLAKPSVSATGLGVHECAHYIAGHMNTLGIPSRILPTGGSPVVYGEVGPKDSGKTLLIYGHYDVQPPDPLSEWVTPPFSPSLRDGRIYARGSGDNKGPHFAHLKAIESFLSVRGDLPIRVKILLEGEEESGSTHLAPFIESNRELLAADGVFSADGPMHESGRPLVFLGLRGIVTFELEAHGANQDFHSGKGGAVPNPAWELVQLLATMRDRRGRVSIRGFYDDMQPPDAAAEEALRGIPFDQDEVLRMWGLEAFDGDPQVSYHHKIMFLPTFNICGLASGYAGEGVRTVIPRKAIVKIDVRLVPDQEPERILGCIRAHMDAHGFGHIRLIPRGFKYPPSRTALTHPFSQAVIRAIAEGFEDAPVVYPSIGASAPDYVFTRILGLPSVWAAYSPHDEQNHAPNENTTVDAFVKGIRSTAALIQGLA
jgi:acetylornithine deacetylase/succinyl-diaminopimelate desuccinylase-like protein